MGISEEMEQLLLDILEEPKKERAELLWLHEQYRQFMQKEGIKSKKAADRCLYQRIYGKEPEKETELLKIRYWRTGHHSPASYGGCLALGRALGLEGKELRFLMQGYYDSCNWVFQEEPEKAHTVYWERRAEMEKLVDQYLSQVPSGRMEQMHIRPGDLRRNIRHLYYTDALHYVRRSYSQQKCNLERHISSINYDSELNRNLRLLGVIPRKTMIRHLFILGMPRLSLDFVDGMLGKLGYLPLSPEHTLRTGERLDLLLIQLLKRYETACAGKQDEEACMLWMQERLQSLDELLDKRGMQRYRFMLFKALESL